MDWIRSNTELLQVALATLSAVVWLAYLQIFYLGFRRQRQSVVMINRGAADDQRARLIVSNMGTEPVYIFALMARIKVEGRSYHAAVTDRDELTLEDLDIPLKRTIQGPLKSGEYVDVGSFADLVWRAKHRLKFADKDDVDEIEITVGAASGHASKLVVARRTFERRDDGETVSFVPTTILTKQIRTGWNRRKALKALDYNVGG